MSHATSKARTVVGNISLSLDGRVTGPGGEYDMGLIDIGRIAGAAERAADVGQP
jgi:hypothetical protein